MSAVVSTASRSITGTPRRVRRASIVAAAGFGSFAVYQAALAAGAPWGDHVWGGRHEGVLPTSLRIGSGVAVGVLVGMAAVVLVRSGVIRTAGGPGRFAKTTWAVSAYMTLNTLGNVASESNVEQAVFGPFTALMAGLTAVVARG